GLGEMTMVYTMGRLLAKRVVVVGLGAQKKLNTQAFRRASAIAARSLQNTGAHSIALALNWEGASFDEELVAQVQVEGALLGTYTFKKYKHSDNNGNGQGVSQIRLVAGDGHEDVFKEAIRRGSILAEATNF